MNGMTEWLIQAGVRVTLLLSGSALLWRWLPATRPALRRGSIVGLTLIALGAPWFTGSWMVGLAGERGVLELGVGRTGFLLSEMVCAFWLAGSGWCLARIVTQWFRLRRVVVRSRRVAVPVPLGTRMCVRESDEISGPCVAGMWRPTMLVPASGHDWSAEQWHMVVGHETHHVRQGDLAISWMLRLLMVCYWWHPLAHWLVRRFRVESEILCDQSAIVHAGVTPRVYAEFLLGLDTRRVPVPSVAMAGRSRLTERIERLLHPGPDSQPGRWRVVAVVTAIVLTALISVSVRTRHPDRPMASPDPVIPPTETSIRLTASPFPADEVL